MSRKLLLIFVVVLVIGVCLTPSIVRTYPFAKDAQGLITLSGLCEDNLSFSPFSINNYIVRPKTAYWMLMNTEFPYENCKDQCYPLVNWAGRSLDIACLNKEKGYELIKFLIARGEPVNDYIGGFAPVHEAILYNDHKYLEILLGSSADPNLIIQDQESKSFELNAFEFLDKLINKNPGRYKDLSGLLKKENI